MSSQRLPVELEISAAIRTAAAEAVPIMVIKSGERRSGAVVLKINRLNGTADVYTQVWRDTELAWQTLASGAPERTADQLLTDQARFDPDVWLLEIEDRQGRLWLSGNKI